MEARKFRESTVEGVTGACDEPAEVEKCVRYSEGDDRRREVESQHNAEMQVLEAVRLEEEGEAEGKL